MDSEPRTSDAEHRRSSAGPGPTDEATAPPAMLPRAIGPYRIVELLGEGGMGAVYLAEQTQPRRRVALKVMRSALATDEARRRFHLEGEVLGRLHHPAIAQVYETGTATLMSSVEIPYLAMEFIPGASNLSDYVAREQLSREATLELFCRIVDGMEHAHQQGVVHRDLKPANIMIDQSGHPKIIDFGLARPVSEDGDLVSVHTRTGSIMGTPDYMSPEQFSGRPDDVGVASDVYTLGVILFEITTGEKPYDLTGMSLFEMVRTVRDQSPRKRTTSMSVLQRDDLDTIIGKAMEKDPQRRYASANALVADVRRYLRKEPVLAKRASALYRTRMFTARHKALVGGFAAVIIVAVVGAIVSLNFAIDAAHRAEEAGALAYQAQMIAGAQALEQGRGATTRQLLAATDPARRGWEHRHLSSRLDREVQPPMLSTRGWASIWPVSDPALLLTSAWTEDELAWFLVDTESETTRLELPRSRPSRVVAVSPDGTRILFGGRRGQSIEMWDVRTMEQVWRKPVDDSHYRSVSWHPSGDRVLLSGPNGLQVRDADSGDVLARSAPTDDRGALPAMSSDGTTEWTCRYLSVGPWLLAEREGLHYRLIDATTLRSPPGAQTLTLPYSFHDSSAIAPAPGSTEIAVGGLDGMVRLLKITDGQLAVRESLRLGDLTAAVAWSPDASLIAAVSRVGNIRVWDAETASIRYESFIEGDLDAELWFTPAGDLISTSSVGGMKRWPTSQPDPNVLRHRSYVYPAALSDDGSILVTGGWDGLVGGRDSLRVWDARTGVAVASYGDGGRGGGSVTTADVSGDGRGVVFSTGEWDAGTQSIDLITGVVRPIADHVYRLAVFPDDRVVTSERAGGTVVRDQVTGKRLWSTTRSVSGPRASQHCPIAISSSAQHLAIDDGRSSIRLIDAETGADVRLWPAHDGPIWSLSFSPDDAWIVSTSEDETVRVWEADTGEHVATLIGHGADVLCAAVSPDGTRIASGGRDAVLRLWDTTRFEQVVELAGHETYIYSIVWSPDAERIYTTSGDGTVRIWDTRTVAEQFADREVRARTMARLEPRVHEALESHDDPHVALRSLLDAGDLEERERELVTQAVMSAASRRWASAMEGASDRD